MLPTPPASPTYHKTVRKGRALLRNGDLRAGKYLKDISNRLAPEGEKKCLEFDEELRRERASTSRIFVGNLSHSVTQITLARVFKVCGPVERVTKLCFVYREDSTCYAEIIFNDPNAPAAAADLNGLLIEGRALVVCHKMAELPEWRPHAQAQSSRLSEN